MNENSNSRRPFRLIDEPKAADEDPGWRVRLSTGEERGPVSLRALRSLVEVGLLDESGEIRANADAAWQPIKDHAVWSQLSNAKPTLRLRSDSSRPLPVASVPVAMSAPSSEITAAMKERLESVHRTEIEKLHRQLRWHNITQTLRWVRELLVFGGFLVVGDFLNSFATNSLGSLHWLISLGVAVVALGYYVLFALGH